MDSSNNLRLHAMVFLNRSRRILRLYFKNRSPKAWEHFFRFAWKRFRGKSIPVELWNGYIGGMELESRGYCHTDTIESREELKRFVETVYPPLK